MTGLVSSIDPNTEPICVQDEEEAEEGEEKEENETGETT